jgi:hypothetical protein
MKTREAYIAAMKSQLDELNASMAAMEAKAQEAGESVQDKYKSGIDELRKQKALAFDKLEELKASGETSWDEMVASMEKVRDAFIHSVNYFKSQL